MTLFNGWDHRNVLHMCHSFFIVCKIHSSLQVYMVLIAFYFRYTNLHVQSQSAYQEDVKGKITLEKGLM